MKIIGLTGGIASGKSTVSEYLRQKYHWPVLDADQLSHQISTQPEIQQQITAQFGDLTRSQLSQLIFTDPSAKIALEKILHPPIIQTIKDQIRVLKEWGSANSAADSTTDSVATSAAPPASTPSNPSFLLLVAPLLVETELHLLCDEIIVLDLPPQIQLARLLARQPVPALDSPALASQIIAAQTPPLKRNQFATFIINNSTTLETLFSQVDQIIHQLENA